MIFNVVVVLVPVTIAPTSDVKAASDSLWSLNMILSLISVEKVNEIANEEKI